MTSTPDKSPGNEVRNWLKQADRMRKKEAPLRLPIEIQNSLRHSLRILERANDPDVPAYTLSSSPDEAEMLSILKSVRGKIDDRGVKGVILLASHVEEGMDLDSLLALHDLNELCNAAEKKLIVVVSGPGNQPFVRRINVGLNCSVPIVSSHTAAQRVILHDGRADSPAKDSHQPL